MPPFLAASPPRDRVIGLSLGPRARPAPRSVAILVVSVLAVWLVGYETNAVWGPGQEGSVLFGRLGFEMALLVPSLLCIARGVLYTKERAAWIAIGSACLLWFAGDVYFQYVLGSMAKIPVPSPADGGYLVFYPVLFAGVLWLFRARSGRTSVAQWLDGLTAALGAAALTAAAALDVVLHSVGGQPMAVATAIAYPLGDLLVMGGIVGHLWCAACAPGGCGCGQRSESRFSAWLTSSISSAWRRAAIRSARGSTSAGPRVWPPWRWRPGRTRSRGRCRMTAEFTDWDA